jgi:hypothetical protein
MQQINVFRQMVWDRRPAPVCFQHNGKKARFQAKTDDYRNVLYARTPIPLPPHSVAQIDAA